MHVESLPVESLPLAPENPLSRRERVDAIRSFHTGMDKLRDAGGPVTRFSIGPRWLIPPIVAVTSPRGIHDVLAIRDGSIDKASTVSTELRRIIGNNLFVMPYDEWQPRRRTLQPVFTKQRVNEFGGHMAQATESVITAWADGATVDLDAHSRTLTLRALGRSVLGLDDPDNADTVADPLREATSYAVARALRPLRAPHWLPTRSRRRALNAAATVRGLAHDILRSCRADPTREAPLVRALIEATDPETGEKLSDSDIVDEMIIFLFAGHDTTATTIAFALWALGRHTEIQDRVFAEVTALGTREFITPGDVAKLPYTEQVLKESLRLCPPGPTGTRMTTRDVEIDGYRVQAGTMIAFGRMAVQRDPSLWDDVLEFNPDRFSPENEAGRDRWQYLPFGGGPRNCIGNHFAMLEATLAVATIVRRVQIRSLGDDFPLAVPFTMVADAPILAEVKRR
ncbi:cytochrome P450 [Mycolicibacterium fortuitum]|uniref:cytochrome P450 n=1 Tax=Mycolicibacterium fortuitum TaxID=1766 RepID=UPI002639F667|nr:cytochrome P450 [Mycolicibacterium fortuitum]